MPDNQLRRKARLLFIAHGDPSRASSRLRVYNWLPYLEQLGVECRVIPYLTMRRTQGRWSRLADATRRRAAAWTTIRRRILAEARWADTIVIQEALLPLQLLDAIHEMPARVVYDFSDPMHMAAPECSWLGRLKHQRIALPRFRRTLRAADHVIVENALLADLAKELGCQTSVMAGPIDVDRIRPRQIGSRNYLNVGWLGSPSTYAQLVPLFPTLDEVGRRCGNLRLTLLGAKETPRLDHVAVRSVPWSLENEARELPDFDIGLCYLEMTPWTRARGGSKLLAYLAAGVAVVSSPAGIGDQVINPGCGRLASSLDEWRDVLLALAQNPHLVSELARNARVQAVKQYSYEAQATTLLSAARLRPNAAGAQTHAAA